MSNSLLDEALQYAGRGFYVFPLWPMVDGKCTCGGRNSCDLVTNAGKHPRIKWKAGATRETREIERWWGRWPDSGIGCATGSSGLVVFDIDGPEGLAQFRAVAGDKLEPTLRARTARGQHIYYRGQAKTSSQKGEKLDVRSTGGYVVLPPSPHRSGITYEWAAELPIAECPPVLLEWANGRKQPAGKVLPVPAWLAPDTSLTGRLARALDATDWRDVVAALAWIPASCDRETWLKVGMSLRSTDWPQAFALWDRWSASCPEKHNKGQTAEYVWSTFRAGGGRGIATLFKVAAAHGYSRAASEVVPVSESTVEKPDEIAPESINKINGQYHLPEALTRETSTNPLIQLNEKYAVIGDIGGKCLVLSWVPSKVDEAVRVPSFQSFKSFSERYANKYISIKTPSGDGGTDEESKQLGPYWLKWTGRRSFEGIDLIPNGATVLPGDVLNLWAGFGVEPRSGSWEGMRWHICNILAGGDQAAANYILNFAAWAVQHPGERAEVALVFRGGKGSGKGTFANALRAIFGQHGLQIYSSKHLVGAFNGHLRNCLLLFADEAFWAGDRQGESVLKGMLTEPALMIEQKGIDATPWKNRLHVIMAANADWVVPASHDERRFAVFDVSPARIGDRGYFERLHHEMASGGLAAMLYDLQRDDLEGWHPRQVVQTAALMEQKARSLGSFPGWWENLLQDGLLPFQNTGTNDTAAAGDILEHARTTASRPQEVNSTSLGRFLKERGCERMHTRTGNFWQFPTLKDARTAWIAKMNGWNWDRDIATWRDNYPKIGANTSQPSHSSPAK